MVLEAFIPLFDFVGMVGFLVALGIGVRGYRDSDFERLFWLAFSFASGLGAVWLGLVTLEWLGIQSVLLDVLSTSLQAVVVGVFAVGSLGTLAMVEDLKASHSETERRRREAETARTRAETRERELEQTREFLQEVEQIADVGGWELDGTGSSVRWSNGARQLFELPEGDLPGLPDALEFVHPGDRETLRQAIEACRREGTPYDVELRIITAEGKERWVHARGERTREAGTPKLRTVIQDVTARKEREQRLMVLNRVLRHNLRNKVNVITVHAEQLENELARVESRAPQLETETWDAIEAITRSADDLEADLDRLLQLLRGREPFSADRARTSVQKILDSSTELTSLSDRVRHFQQAIQRDESPGAVDLGPLVETIVTEYRQKHPDTEITFATADTEVLGNPEGVRLAVGELIENAIKHAEGSTTRVVIEVAEQTAGRVPIRVKDTGPGIPPVERQVLSQGEETPLLHGSGLGLWTVNWVMTRFGGSVEITDNQPDGTVVTLLFPSAERG